MTYTKEQAREGIAALVQTFRANETVFLKTQQEAQVENDYVRPLFRYLNWNTENSGLASASFEFVLQRTDRLKKRPDYVLQLDGNYLLVMDAKRARLDMHAPHLLNQVYAYAYSTQNSNSRRKIDFAILTDFQEFIVLDCTLLAGGPRALTNFRVLDWRYEDYLSEFDTLWELFEREHMRAAAPTRYTDAPAGLWARRLEPKTVKANRTPPDKAFLADMDDEATGWRVRLAKDMKKHNQQADGALITAAVQLWIDRLIFVKALSDREIEEDYLAQLAEIVEKDGLKESDTGWFKACQSIFERLNHTYNGSIFAPRPELEAVSVSNKVVREIIRELQPENSPYNFAVLPVEILGTIYERFLGRVVTTTDKRVKIEEKPEVRKAGGVYYTPQYIVEYIVKNTVGKLLEACQTPEEVASLRILDPACGSGSFLLGAYAALIDWHSAYYGDKSRLTVRDRQSAYYDDDGRVRLTARLKRQILLNNLYGVDIDPQAVEVTRFSLSLKALEDTRRDELYDEVTLFHATVLPDLRANIQCGNSLVAPDYFSGQLFPDPAELKRVNPFDWAKGFPQVFRSPGRDLYLVTFVTHNSRVSERMVEYGVKTGEPLTLNTGERYLMAQQIAECIREHHIPTIAWNVLPDHVHMILAAESEKELDVLVRKIKGFSSFAFQRALGMDPGGHVWAQKYHHERIADQKMLDNGVAYVLENHLKHAEQWGQELADGWEGLSAIPNQGLSAIPNQGLSAIPNQGLSAIQNQGLSAIPNQGLSAIPNQGLSAIPNQGLSAIPNQGLSAIQNQGLSAIQNQGLSAIQNQGLSAIPNQGLSAIQNQGLSAIPNQGLSAIPNQGLSAITNKGLKPLVLDSCVTVEEACNPQTGGFDAVIGNPPYVRQEGLGKFKAYFEAHYQSYQGMADLYTYFVEKGLSLLRLGGLFSYIVANKWMRANYGLNLRRFLKKQQIIEMIDFGDLRVFESATTYPCILVIEKAAPHAPIQVTQVGTSDFYSLNEYVQANRYPLESEHLEDSGWSLADPGVQALLHRIQAAGKPLGEYVDGKIFYGIKTGLNEAFVIDAETRARLIEQDPRSAELIKPFLAGRNIKRYEPPSSERFLIFTQRGVRIKKFPAILAYLTQFKDRLIPRPKDYIGEWKGRKPGNYQWYEIQDTVEYSPRFEEPKIIIPAIVQSGSYILDMNGFYSNDKTSIIASQALYLLGLLNSRVCDFFLHSIASTKQGGYYEYKPMYVERIPIRVIDFTDPADAARHARMLTLVEGMLALHRHKAAARTQSEQELYQRQIEAADAAIDRLVYELYGLTEEEVRIVEGSG
jgi:REP element-mobilizing transposase RayT